MSEYINALKIEHGLQRDPVDHVEFFLGDFSREPFAVVEENWDRLMQGDIDFYEAMALRHSFGIYVSKNPTHKRILSLLISGREHLEAPILQKGFMNIFHRDIHDILRFYKKIKAFPGREMMRAIDERVGFLVRRSPDYKTAAVYRALANLNFYPQSFEAYEALSLKLLGQKGRIKDHESFKHVFALIRPYVRYGQLPSEEFISEWEDKISRYMHHISRLNLRDGYAFNIVASTLNACSVLNSLSGEVAYLRSLAKSCHRYLRNENMHDHNKSKFAQSGIWFGFHNRHDYPLREGVQSRGERRLAKVFARVAPNMLTLDMYLPQTGHRVDLAFCDKVNAVFTDKKDRPLVLLELDGPPHLIKQLNDEGYYETRGYDGPTHFRTLLIADQMPEAVLIRARHDIIMKFMGAKRLEIAALLDEALHRKPGAYRLDEGYAEKGLSMLPFVGSHSVSNG